VPTDFACDGGNCGNCGPNTKLEFDDAGVAYCVGTGGGGVPCNQELNCPAPASGKFMVCGRLWDLGTTARLEGTTLATTIKIDLYDALGFANNPTTTQPIGSATIDECGRYIADNGGVTPPFTGYVAVATDDKDGAMPGMYARVGVATPSSAGMKVTLNAFVMENDLDMAWSTMAAIGGQTFVQRGIYVPVFVDGSDQFPAGLDATTWPFKGLPVGGVKILENGMVKAANDYYFTDTNPVNRLLAAPSGGGDVTTINGSGLYTGGTLTMYSGTGGEPAGCTWPSTLAATIPNVVFVQERVAECP
jgi:hypothetical protein